MSNERVSLASPACLLHEVEEPAPGLAAGNHDRALLHSLGRVFGVNTQDERPGSENRLFKRLCPLFTSATVTADQALERHDRPWQRVYLVQHGILRLFRESPQGKVAIHHFFAEGAIVWPVFGRSRTVRNTLCLSAVTPAKLWVADFRSFRDTLRNECEGQWARFALSLTEELAELAIMREYHRQTLSARERYRIMVRDYPELIRRIPDFQLAAWLGVAPATFSRLKRVNGR